MGQPCEFQVEAAADPAAARAAACRLGVLLHPTAPYGPATQLYARVLLGRYPIATPVRGRLRIEPRYRQSIGSICFQLPPHWGDNRIFPEVFYGDRVRSFVLSPAGPGSAKMAAVANGTATVTAEQPLMWNSMGMF
jgi:hypothetical protein